MTTIPCCGRRQDMANHEFAAPTANFAYDGGVEPGVFRLQATRNMSAGEEVRRAASLLTLFILRRR